MLVISYYKRQLFNIIIMAIDCGFRKIDLIKIFLVVI